jgi:hypothetical protein
MTTTELTWQDIPKKLRDKINATARRGAKLLDKERPGWHNKIDVGRLDVQHACQCVYGQLRAEEVFQDKLDTLGSPIMGQDYYFGYELHRDAQDWAYRKSLAGGFSSYKLAWDWLQEEWLREIYTRREADLSVSDAGEQA